MMPRQKRLLVVAWAGWACVVLGFYYVELLRAVRYRRLPVDFDALAASAILLLAVGVGLMVWRLELPPVLVTAARQRYGGLRPERWPAVLGLAGIGAVPWFLVWPGIATRMARISVPHFPFAGEAAARMIPGLVGASLVLAAALGAGMIVLRLVGWSSTSRSEQLVFAAVSGVLVVSYGSLLLAVLGIYRPWTVAVLIGLLCLAGAFLSRPVRPGPAAVTTPARAFDALWMTLAGVALAFALIAALAPEKEYDALWYHLNLPRLWLDAGRPVDLIEEYVSLYPLTWELMFGDGLVLGGAVAAKLLHFACLPLLATLVWRAARRYLPGTSSAAAVALVVTTPTMLWQAGTAYVDLALTLHTAAACYALARYAEEGERGWGIVAALQFGAAAATKHLGIVVTLTALGLYVVASVRHGRDTKGTLRRALQLGLAAAAIPSPWYIRSWLASGNPVFPEMFGVFGAFPSQRWDVFAERGLAQFKAHFGIGRSVGDLVALPWDLTVHGALFGGSLGPLFLVLMPGALLARHHRTTFAWLCAGTVAYMAFWASPISSYQMRFLMPVVPALALMAAASLESVTAAAADVFRSGSGAIPVAVLLLGTMNLPPLIRLHEADRAGWDGWLTHVVRSAPLEVAIGRESEAMYLGREVPSYGAWRKINAASPIDARILTFTGGDRFYAQRRYLPYDATMARPVLFAATAGPDHVVEALRNLGITHVLFDRRELARLNVQAVVFTSPAFQQGCDAVYKDRRFWLCELDYPRLVRAINDVVSARPEASAERAR